MRLGPGSDIERAKAASNASAVWQRTAGTPRPLARLTQSIAGIAEVQQLRRRWARVAGAGAAELDAEDAVDVVGEDHDA